MSDKNNKRIKQLSIAIAVCLVVLGGMVAASVGMYKSFYDNNKETIETASDNNLENEPQDGEEETIELIDPETIEIEEEEEEEKKKEELESEPEKKEEKLTEEEKKQREEETKKKQEELKKKKEEEAKRAAQGYPYYIKVNYSANTVTIYKKDENGNFTVPYKAMVCSSGASTPHSGVYRTPQKARWGVLIGPVWGQYCTRITGQILFHSVPYLKKEDPSSLEYWEYDRLGVQRSMGCIRLTVADAKWIFDNCPLGTSVEFYSNPSNPGPLGKPGIQPVSNAGEPYRGWDPTDPNPNNPWHNKKAAEEKAAKEKAEKEAAEKKAAEEKAAKEKAEKEAAEKKAAEEKAAKEKAEKEEAERKATEEKAKQEKTEKVTVPNVVGLTENEAKKQLQAKGFTVTVKTEEDDANADKVIKQSLVPGSEQNKGTAIIITVGKKKQTTVVTIENGEDDKKQTEDKSNNKSDKTATDKSNTGKTEN